MSINWSHYLDFNREEFDCKETGENDMQPYALDLFQRIRAKYGKPMTVLSGYRSVRHSEESHKAEPGAHTQGTAGDFRVTNAADRYRLVKIAIEEGAQGIGVAKSFVHIDAGHATAPRPAMWSY